MINKILVFGGFGVFAILLIENMVMSYPGYVLWFTSKTYILVVTSTIVGILIGYGIKGYSTKEDIDDGEIDF